MSPIHSRPSLTFVTHLLPKSAPVPTTRISASRCARRIVMSTPSVTFVTGNQNKLREVTQILSADGVETPPVEVVARKVDLPELQGEPEDIVRQKCVLAVEQVQGPTVRLNSSHTTHTHSTCPSSTFTNLICTHMLHTACRGYMSLF